MLKSFMVVSLVEISTMATGYLVVLLGDWPYRGVTRRENLLPRAVALSDCFLSLLRPFRHSIEKMNDRLV